MPAEVAASAGGDSLPRRVTTAVVAIPVVIVVVLVLPTGALRRFSQSS